MKKVDNQRVSCAAIIINEKKEILLLQRSNKEKFFSGEWELPGGGTMIGEDPENAIKREVKEECNLAINPIAPISIVPFTLDEEGTVTQWIEIIFYCKLSHLSQSVLLSEEHTQYQWLSLEASSIQTLRPFIREIIMSFLESPFYNIL